MFKKIAIVLSGIGLTACAGFALPEFPGGGSPATGGFDPVAVAFLQQSAVFALCPKENRAVEVVNGQLRLSCAGAVVEPCPEGQVVVGVRVFIDEKRAEPVCGFPTPAPNPPVDPAPTPVPAPEG